MVTPLLVLSGVGFVMAVLLAIGRKVFHVEVDQRQELIMDILPGANCGGCGAAGCSGFAAALVAGKAAPTACPPGGADLAEEIGKILGVEVEASEPVVAIVACAGDNSAAPARSRYLGLDDCVAANTIAGGPKSCTYGCLGLGSCQSVCPFDAIHMTDNGLAIIDKELCTGCKKCVEACPRGIIKMVPKRDEVAVLCINPNKAKAVKAACSVGCTGCKLCTKQSPAFKMDGAIARVESDKETDIPETAALACPQGAIFDGSRYSLVSWITESSSREDYDRRSAEWKEAEKKRKAEAKKAKEAAKAAKEAKAAAAEKSQGGEA